jgi:hypothetical protein
MYRSSIKYAFCVNNCSTIEINQYFDLIKSINLIIELIISKTSLIPIKYGIEEMTSALPLGGVGGFDDRTKIIVRIKLAIDGILQIIL